MHSEPHNNKHKLRAFVFFMLRLLKRDIAPADEFSYVHFETGYTSKASDWYTWRDNINAHRKSNELPPITMAEAEDQLCRRLGPDDCSYADASNPPKPLNTRISFNDVVEAMKIFTAWIASGLGFVAQAEAERRADVCVRCWANVQAEGCGACTHLAEMVTNTLGQRRTKNDARLKVCGFCKCSNAAQIHAPIEVLELKAPEIQESLPEWCWQKRQGSNFVPDQQETATA